MARGTEQPIAAARKSDMLQPIDLYHTPSPRPQSNAAASGSSGASSSTSASRSGLTIKQKRAARACDVCRSNHRKCPGPAPGSDACERCIKQHKVCTWFEYRNRVARRAAASASPKTPKRRKISIRRSNSTPSPLPPNPPSRLPQLDESGPSSSSPLSSSDEEQEPATPVESYQPLAFSFDKHAEPEQESADAFSAQFSAAPSVALPNGFAQQPVQSESYSDYVELANRDDVLLFIMPLESFENRQLRGDGASRADVELRCITPSYIDPAPTQREAMDMLDAILLDVRTFSNADAAPAPAFDPAFFPQGEIEAAHTSDEEPFRPVTATETSSIDGTSGTDSASSQSTLPTHTQEQSIDIIFQNDDASSEPEPDFSFDFAFDASQLSQLELKTPFREEHDGSDPFLFPPCNCVATPRAQRITTSPVTSANESSASDDQVQVKDEQASWDECMPDVIDDASLDAMLDEWLHIDQATL